ncbi:monovalent cation/H(+) antiporter subunit G [Kaistia terrae]|uniref:Monovalent cation/H(+) antiporter subunit G n=1 Tax=Kaistia terrae TaxID=537017 RepID=A0ABW0PQK1_9HYPH|nr:monovalent cation/H(+) antiporter subunit G [Kaistia terrae]MCX5577863.1 monovalent cation/H(+) antiporter subunit G [Kaistia terrae]
MIEIIGSLFILAGAIFLFSAGVGILRMPDTFTRIQSGTKATTLGNMLVLTGLAFYHPGWTFKLVLAIYFVLMTNPISSHALSRAAYRIRTPMTPSTSVDMLAEDEAGEAGAKPPAGNAGRRKRS